MGRTQSPWQRIGVLLLALALLALAVKVTPVRAYDVLTYDFRASDFDWGWFCYSHCNEPVWELGSGWRSVNGGPPGAEGKQINIARELVAPIIVYSVEIEYTQPSESIINNNLKLQSQPGYGSGVEAQIEFDTSGYQVAAETYPAGTGPVNYLYIHASSSTHGPPHTYIHTITIEYETYTAPDAIVRPLEAGDEHPQWEMFDYHYVHTLDDDWDIDKDAVYGFSAHWGAYVHAAVEGEVVLREPVTLEDCNAQQLLIKEACLVFIPPAITDDGNLHVYRLNLTDAPIYRVQIRFNHGTDEGVIQYIVADADQYIEPGTTVREGCILGKTIQLQHLTDTVMTAMNINAGLTDLGISITFEKRSILTDNGVVFMMWGNPDTGETWPLLDYLTLESALHQACNEDPVYTACYGDPELRHPDDWNEVGVVAWNNPGVTLSTNLSGISQVLPLDSETAYSMTVQAAKTGTGEGRLRLQIGGTTETFLIQSDINLYANYVIADDFHPADYAGYYTIGITNIGTAPLRIRSVCVTDGPHNLARNSCYFFNPSFDIGNTGWTLSGGVENWGGGDLRVPSGETFSQNVHLFPDDGETTYTLSLKAWLWATPDFEPQLTDITNTVDVQYQWPDTAGWVSMDDSPHSFSEFVYLPQMIWSYSFHVSAETNSTLSIRPVFDSTEADVFGLAVGEVCLYYGLYDLFPGDLGYGGQDPNYDPICQYIGPPTSHDIGGWLSWHWAKLNRFFHCELMIILNDIWELVAQFKELVGWFFRYIMALARYSAEWLSTDLMPWLGGHFHNMAAGQTMYITVNEETECNNLFCMFTSLFDTGGSVFGDLIDGITEVFDDLIFGITSVFDDLTATIDNLVSNLASLLSQAMSQLLAPIVETFLGIINQVVGVLLTIILGIVQLAIMLIGMVFTVFNHMTYQASALLNAWNNATPTPIPGLPTCATDPKAHVLCVGLWMLENTVFSGPGQLLIPILIGYGSVMLLLWAIGEFKKTITEAGKAL